MQPQSENAGPDPVHALERLRDWALPPIPAITAEQVRTEYDVLRTAWSAAILAEGDWSSLEGRLLRYLEVLRLAPPGFAGYEVHSRPNLSYAQINAVYRDRHGNALSVSPLRVWKVADRFFACGNSLFT